MSDTNKTSAQWKSEQQRAERKERLAKMKSKDGGKKQIKTTNPAVRITVSIIVIIALLWVGVWAAIRSGLPHHWFTAVTIGSIEVKAVDVNYYYYQQLSAYGLNPAESDSQDTLKADSGIEGFKTNADYLKDQAVQQLQQDVMLADQAQKAGITLAEEDAELIETYLANLKQAAAQEGQTFDNYLVNALGPGMNEAVLRRCVERMLLADRFAEEKKASFTFDEAELQAAYEKDKNQYDLVDYRAFYFASNAASDATSAEKTKAMEEAKNKADEMLSRITDEDSFRALCIEYSDKEESINYQTNDASLYTNKYYNNITPIVVRDWLFDEARKPGDKSVVESTSGYYVLMFLNRQRADYERVNVRHILIQVNRQSASDEEIETARKKAQSILDTYLNGEKTEEAFAALAKENSADSNAEQGGLYEGIYRGQMVSEFDAWCFDPARKAGDTGLIQTDYGFHVMYFIGKDGIDWKIRAEETLREEAFQKYLDELVKQYPYSINAFGYRFVG